MVNVFNHTAKTVSETIEAEQIVVPPNGHTQTSPRKADKLIELHPGEVGLEPRPSYTADDFKEVQKLNKRELQHLARNLMLGRSPAIEEMREGVQEAEQPALNTENESDSQSAEKQPETEG